MVLQVPNAQLTIALIASVAGRFTEGVAHGYISAVFYLALGIWAFGEASGGVNWFRRLLGVGFLIYVVVRLATALQA